MFDCSFGLTEKQKLEKTLHALLCRMHRARVNCSPFAYSGFRFPEYKHDKLLLKAVSISSVLHPIHAQETFRPF